MAHKLRCKQCDSLIVLKSLKDDEEQICPYCNTKIVMSETDVWMKESFTSDDVQGIEKIEAKKMSRKVLGFIWYVIVVIVVGNIKESHMDDIYTLIAFIVGFFVVPGVWIFIFEKERSKVLKVIANSMGLSFRRKQKLPSEVVSAKFYLFSLGSSKIMNLMSGNLNNINISLFGYNYTTGDAEHGKICKQTVALFSSESINLPNFDLRPEGVFDKIASVFGYQDIDFESHPQFSRSYLPRGKNENAIRRIFTDDVLTFFSNNMRLSVEVRILYM